MPTIFPRNLLASTKAGSLPTYCKNKYLWVNKSKIRRRRNNKYQSSNIRIYRTKTTNALKWLLGAIWQEVVEDLAQKYRRKRIRFDLQDCEKFHNFATINTRRKKTNQIGKSP